MSASSEYDAAYFTMLRAIEERDTLVHYQDYLVDERERLDAFTAALRERAEAVPRKVRRPVDHTQRAVLEAVGRRRSVVLDELRRMDDRLAAAAAFVEECEREVAALRR